MGPLELEATVEVRHSGKVAWRSSDPPDRSLARPVAEGHLRWYFGDAAGELGLRAMNLEPTPGGSDGVAAAERQTLAYIRFTSVRRVLLALAADDRRVLSLAYLERTWPTALSDWYEKAGVGAWLWARYEQAGHGTIVSVDDAAHALAALASQQARAGDVALLRARAERRLREALGRFCEAWNG
jgi:hypothetical protein